jgi:hypothetical protein
MDTIRGGRDGVALARFVKGLLRTGTLCLRPVTGSGVHRRKTGGRVPRALLDSLPRDSAGLYFGDGPTDRKA